MDGIAFPESTRSSVEVIEVRPDGVGILTLDGRGAENVVTPAFVEALVDAVTAATRNPRIDAVVLRSNKPDFVVGTDPRLLRSLRFAQDAEDLSRSFARAFARLDRDKPVVAWIDGAALGAGFELALACTAIVASDDARTAFGFTELARGLSSVANGPLRLARRAGLRYALDLATTGRIVRPLPALRRGIVDEVVPPFTGLDAACALARELVDPRRRRAFSGRHASKQWLERALFETNPIGRHALFRAVRQDLRARTRGHDPAAERTVDVLERYAKKGFRAAADLEPRLFGDTVVSESANRRLDLFFARQGTIADPGVDEETLPVAPLGRLAIVGAGRIGAGVALISAEAGLDVRLKDTKIGLADRGLRDAFGAVGPRPEPVPRRERESLIGKVTRASDYARIRDAGVVLEAVSEDLALKRQVLREIEQVVPASVVIATTTAALSITAIAHGTRHPERVVGMRYFKPVAQTQLVEIVRTERAEPRAIAIAVALGKRQGKTVIVVRDQPAFYTPRLLVAYVGEALRLVAEGCAIDVVDTAMLDWGFPVGPLRLLDEVGFRTSEHVCRVASDAFGPRLALSPAFAKLLADGRKGRKNDRGFYTARRAVDTSVYAVLGVTPQPKVVSPDDIALRIGFAVVNEAVRALGDGVVRSPRDGDVGAVFGAGFPAFRGGPFRYIDMLGLPEVLRRIRSLEQRFGERFEPAPLLVESTRSGQRFY